MYNVITEEVIQMYITIKGKKYKFNSKKLLKNICGLIGIITFIALIGLAGASDLASGIY